MEATYSSLGLETLVEGQVEVMISGDRLVSVMDTFLQSFCCGEGDLQWLDGEYYLTAFGQVQHTISALIRRMTRGSG